MRLGSIQEGSGRHFDANLVRLGQILVWFDRVDSASNPVDGLSRKNFSGAWQWREIFFPASLKTALERVVSHRLSSPKSLQ